jgi:enoyl-CoA hydratase
MSLTGNFVDAGTALGIGIVNRVLPHDELLPVTRQLAGAIAEQDRHMVRTMRHDWNATSGRPIDDARLIHHNYAAETGSRNVAGSDLAARREAALSRSRAQRRA